MLEHSDHPARQGHSLIGFYVALGAIAVVAVTAAYLFKPLKRQYAIYRFESAGSFQEVDDWAVQLLRDSASSGDRRAFEALLSSRHPDLDFIKVMVPRMAREQRAVFYAVMARAPDEEAIILLQWLSCGIHGYYGGGETVEGRDYSPILRMISEMEQLQRKSDEPQVAELTSEFLPVARRRGVDALIGRLKQSDTFERCCAAWALGELQDARAIKPLERLLSDPETSVRSAANEAIESIRAVPSVGAQDKVDGAEAEKKTKDDATDAQKHGARGLK